MFTFVAMVAGLIVAVAYVIHRKGGRNALRTVAVRSVAAILALGAVIAGGLDIRATAYSHLGLLPSAPAVQFEIRLPATAALTDLKREAQVQLLTDKNQTLAQLDNMLGATDDGRSVLRGQVPLNFRSSERYVVLSLPGQAQRLFKLRLTDMPGRSEAFGPWHLVDRVETAGRALPASGVPDDSFAIRYRVL